jgi:hypothetical protein
MKIMGRRKYKISGAMDNPFQQHSSSHCLSSKNNFFFGVFMRRMAG